MSEEIKIKKRLFGSISFQVLTSIFIVMLLGIMSISYFAYKRADKILTEDAFTEMENHLIREQDNFEQVLNDLRQNVQFFSQVPPIQGIIRSLKYKGYDPEENTTEVLWKLRLKRIFLVMLKSKSDYSKIRFIGKPDGGREIVRVDRKAGGIVSIEEKDLQRKGSRDYFLKTLELEEGVLYVHEINLKREHGKISRPFQPVLRVATPIYDETTKDVFGIVVINMDVSKVFQTLESRAGESYFTISNEEGYYLFHPDVGKRFGFEFNQDIKIQKDYPQLENLFRQEWDRKYPRNILANDKIIIMSGKINYSPRTPERFLVISIVGSSKSIYKRSTSFRNGILFILTLITLVLGIVGYLNTKRIVAPVLKLTSIAGKIIKGNWVKVETDKIRGDEIRELAYTFNFMTEKIKGAMQALEEEKLSLEVKVEERTSDLTKEIAKRKETEEELRKHRDQLEELVEERTVDLSKAVGELESEIAVRKRAEEALRATHDEMEAFVYTVSHDLRTPIVTLGGYVKALQEDCGDSLGELAQGHLSYIQEGAKKLGTIVSNLLHLSRAGRELGPRQVVPVSDLIEGSFEELAPLLEERYVEFEVTCGPFQITCDPDRFAIVFTNLIGNAIKYMGDQTAPLIEIGGEEHENEYRFFVRDNGMGIYPQYHSKIFELFQTLGDSEGTGVGLALVKKIVAAHGGRVWVESGVGQGSTFYFTLPKHPVEAEHEAGRVVDHSAG